MWSCQRKTVTATRHSVPKRTAGRSRLSNADRHLKGKSEHTAPPPLFPTTTPGRMSPRRISIWRGYKVSNQATSMSPQRERHEAIRNAIDLAIHHIHKEGFDDLFRPPFFRSSLELELIRSNFDDFKSTASKMASNFIKTANLSKEPIGDIYPFLYPKDAFTFRRVAWIDPFDLVKYLSLSILAFPFIEAHRPPCSSKVVHSHRPSSLPQTLFDKQYGYDSFRAASSALTRQYSVGGK